MNELEATRAKLKCLEMVEGTELEWWKCVKHQGYLLRGRPDDLVDDKCEYELALGVVENRPVWKGDDIYFHDRKVHVCDGYVFSESDWSWNPTTHKNVMVELPFEFVKVNAENNMDTLCLHEACRKALEKIQ